MTVRVYQWSCSQLAQEERDRQQYGPGYRYYGNNVGHDGLSFAWDGVEDPFQPETAAFGKIARDGYKPEKSAHAGSGHCRCGGYLQHEAREATPAETESYLAAKRVRVPASMLAPSGGTMTGAMTVAAAHPDQGGSIAELVKLFREQITVNQEALKELRSMLSLSTNQILQVGNKANLPDPSVVAPGTIVVVGAAANRLVYISIAGEWVQFKTEVVMAKSENGVEIETKKSLAARIKDSAVVQSVTAETKDASWRGAALMTIDLAKSCLEKAKPFLPKQYQKFHKPMMEFVATPLGGSALAYAAGALLSAPFMPGAGTGKQKRIAYELRVNATTVAGYTLIKPLVGFMTNVALGGFAGILATLPDVDEATGVRVAASEQTAAHEGDESDSAVINAHNAAVRAAKATK